MMKKAVMTIGIITVLLLASQAHALDGAGLYIERTCIACHGVEGRVPVMSEYPKIAGQNAPYMLAQMKDIKSGTRSHAHTVAMKNVMHLISDEEMAAVAEWLAGLPE
ncbi:MAG: c-type cytochrome [Pseudomonadota bacterium]|nr:c-type cytochrome [Pseudomonadota bacterium]